MDSHLHNINLNNSGNATSRPRSRFGHKGCGSILVLDDELFVLDVAGEIFREMGYHVETASSGEKAVEIYRKAKAEGRCFFAAILDLSVPQHMGGKDVVRLLRELDPRTHMIATSGYSNDPIMANPREFGFCAVIPKPWNIDEISAVLDALYYSV
jgi:two-component system, cell cycle sensor histidine kinase and response regulator CckA